MITAFMTCGQLPRWRSRLVSLLVLSVGIVPLHARAQVNSGSDGHDGAFNPTTNTVIDMADHPDGIYHYTSVNVSTGVTVTFIPNAHNTPVAWLVQSNCVIAGTLDISGKKTPDFDNDGTGAIGGPGGFRGGNGGVAGDRGQGPGGGDLSQPGAFGTFPFSYNHNNGQWQLDTSGSPTYGNQFLLPIVGGSGGGGSTSVGGAGGGGGGSLLVVASETIEVSGAINANGGGASAIRVGYSVGIPGGGASGGSVRLVATRIAGRGVINADGGTGPGYYRKGGYGRVRFDTYESNFGGQVVGAYTQGMQPIVFLLPGQGPQLSLATIAGIALPVSPTGVLTSPDVVIPAQQANPVPVVVQCSSIPLNTEVTVEVHPTVAPIVRSVGLNAVGTLESSTATVSVNIPRGGGVLFAKAVTGINSNSFASVSSGTGAASIAQTGWTADGERFVAVEVTSSFGGGQQLAYLTASGKRYKVPAL